MIDRRVIYLILAVAAGILCVCSESPETTLADVNPKYLTCLAYDCHQGTPLRIFPPVSGLHGIHMNNDCESCHYGYYTNPLHKNGFVNGFDWISNTNAPGMVVFYAPDVPVPPATWNDANGTCGAFNCHGGTMGAADSWYRGP